MAGKEKIIIRTVSRTIFVCRNYFLVADLVTSRVPVLVCCCCQSYMLTVLNVLTVLSEQWPHTVSQTCDSS